MDYTFAPAAAGAAFVWMILLIWVVYEVLMVVWGIKAAESRGRPALLGFAMGFFLGPIGIIILYCLPKEREGREIVYHQPPSQDQRVVVEHHVVREDTNEHFIEQEPDPIVVDQPRRVTAQQQPRLTSPPNQQRRTRAQTPPKPRTPLEELQQAVQEHQRKSRR
jgi:hypothetical protein